MNTPNRPSTDDVLGLESPLDALRASDAFRGPVESPDGDFYNDHFALIYESPEEQFAAAVPFVRQGLERGERCMYVVDERSEDAVRTALREGGIDVESALESGELTIETIQETYLKGGGFDTDEMMDLYEELIAEATEEYEAFRLAADMSWILEADVTTEECMEYESEVNALFDDEDAIAICQYDRERFPSEVLRDVIRVHPHLIYDTTVCHNFYYTPPEEFCQSTRSAHELDRMLRTLVDRTAARVELQERERYLQRQNEIVADPEKTFEEKLQALFDLGCERFDLELGAMARVDTDADWFQIEYISDEHEHFEPGIELPLSETYCAAATEIKAAGSVADPEAEGYDDIFVCREFGIRSYLGTYIDIEDGTDRTFFFISPETREDGFTDHELAFLQSMGQWVQYELQQRQHERQLEKRERQYRTLAESFPNGVVTLFDTDHQFTLAAGQGFEDLPLDGDEIEGQTIDEAWGDEAASIVGPAYEDALNGEERVVEVEYADREWRIHVVPIRDENGDVFAGMTMAQDITEQKERERFLEDAKAQLEAATEAGAVGTWEWHVPEDRFVAGASLAKQFGVDPEAAREGVSLDTLVASIYEDDRDRVVAKIDEALESCGEYEAEYRVYNADDELRWVVARGHVECDEAGDPLRFPGALTDITERKRDQQRLEETIDKLETSNERLERFAYAASHDLQEPLRMVSSYLRLIERRYEDALDDAGEEYLEFAINGADRMRDMIDALLDYSRVHTQGDPLEPLDLDSVFQDTLSDLNYQIERSDAEITAETLPRVRGDPQQLRQLFQNLLENAITYSGDDPPRIYVTAERDDSDWIVSVRDEGIGIDPDDQERIFEVFQRLHSREEYSGSGVGLALCQRIVERHDGEIWVESEPGDGATFSFSLPPATADST